jgi:hypothetical protein
MKTAHEDPTAKQVTQDGVRYRIGCFAMRKVTDAVE